MIRTKRKLTKEQRERIEASLRQSLSNKRITRTGMSSKLYRGEEVEKTITPKLEELSQKTTKEVDTKVQSVVKSMETRLNAQFKYAVDKMEEKLLLAIANMPKPRDGEDGKAPSKQEIARIVSEMMGSLNKKQSKNDKTGLSLFTDKDKSSLVEMIREEAQNIVKNKPTQLSGGGITYAYQIKDLPAKTRGTGPTYAGNEGKALVVSSDGKRIDFGSTAGVAVETPTGTANGSNTDFTVSNEPKYVVVNALTYFDGAGYTYSGGTITFDIPPVTGSSIRSIY